MKKHLYARNGRVFTHGTDADEIIPYQGSQPEFVIRLNHPSEPVFVACKSEATRIMNEMGNHDITLVPVESEAQTVDQTD
ncbi:MAG: hypothetical protein AAF468_15095 [Pseudomonadota bacterium]